MISNEKSVRVYLDTQEWKSTMVFADSPQFYFIWKIYPVPAEFARLVRYLVVTSVPASFYQQTYRNFFWMIGITGIRMIIQTIVVCYIGCYIIYRIIVV